MNDSMMTPISLEESFCFSCSCDLPCLNECCRDMHQYLTPYDILRLKQEKGLASPEFLARYTGIHEGSESGLPVVTLVDDASPAKRCCFATPDGCAVYAARPVSCRTYPVARAISRSRESGEITEYFMLMKEPHCKGFDRGEPRSVSRWIDDQEIREYNRQSDMLMELISLKNRIMPGRLDERARDLFILALYDLDNFREQLLGQYADDIPEGTVHSLNNDDEALLAFGIQWIKHRLFGIPMLFRPLPPHNQ